MPGFFCCPQRLGADLKYRQISYIGGASLKTRAEWLQKFMFCHMKKGKNPRTAVLLPRLAVREKGGNEGPQVGFCSIGSARPPKKRPADWLLR